jgi:membrane-associated phospholipid phosphatase
MGSIAQGRAILRGFGHLVRRGWLVWILFAAAVVVLSVILFPQDQRLLARLHESPFEQTAFAQRAARFLGFWGDYPTYNLPLAVGIWLYGLWRKNSGIRRLAVICFLGATLAGGLDDCFRLTLGRPRPDAHHPDGFYGLPAALKGGFESFPSGHAAAVFGTAASLLAVDLPLGLLTTLFALAVVWARMELYRHYPSDVAVGSLIGITLGLLVGLGSRVRRTRGPRTSLGRP